MKTRIVLLLPLLLGLFLALRAPESKTFTLILDAGHGGHDPGARVNGLPSEAHLNLELAQRLRAVAEEQGIRVLMTRSQDEFVSLADRVAKYSQEEADWFVSIHLDPRSEALGSGARCYYSEKNRHAEASQRLATQLTEALSKVSSVHDPREVDFMVLAHSESPAVLIDFGFVSNPTRVEWVQNAETQQQTAESIVAVLLSGH